MNTDVQDGAEVSQIPDAFADAWAAVFIDVYEKLKERGELPDDDEPNQGDESCST